MSVIHVHVFAQLQFLRQHTSRSCQLRPIGGCGLNCPKPSRKAMVRVESHVSSFFRQHIAHALGPSDLHIGCVCSRQSNLNPQVRSSKQRWGYFGEIFALLRRVHPLA